MLRYSLTRELENIIFFKKKIGGERYEDSQFYYTLLETKQVLTVTPKKGDKTKFWKTLPQRIIWVPFVINSVIFFNDLSTIELGKNVSGVRAWVGVALSALFVCVVYWITSTCKKAFGNINKEWQSMYEDIQENSD